MENHNDFHHDDLLERAVDAVLRDPGPGELPPDRLAQLTAAVRQAAGHPSPITLSKRTRPMKNIPKIAAAATIVMALGGLLFWMALGTGSAGIALANVADALDSLRSATFDLRSEARGEEGQPPATATGQGFFLAPSHHRMEISVNLPGDPAVKAAEAAARKHQGPDKAAAQAAAKAVAEAFKRMPRKMKTVFIYDTEAAKSLTLSANTKLAVLTDMTKRREEMEKAHKSLPPDLFALVRRLVRKGSSGTGDEVERLGTRRIDGREAVGFRTRVGDMDMTLWADPETARPVRIEVSAGAMADVHMVMSNFRYDVDLDPAMFSLEPPEGYATVAVEMKMPTEEDLLRTLRVIAEHNKGVFPAKFGMNQQVMESLMADQPNLAMDKSTQKKMEATMEKVLAKYGGEEKLRAKYGKQKSFPARDRCRVGQGTGVSDARVDSQTVAAAHATATTPLAGANQGNHVLHVAEARQRSPLRRRRREARHARSPDPLVQAHRRRRLPCHLRGSERQGPLARGRTRPLAGCHVHGSHGQPTPPAK